MLGAFWLLVWGRVSNRRLRVLTVGAGFELWGETSTRVESSGWV
jgi:hypothetical protein